MLDKRCTYKIRECKDFYLFIKYKRTHIYYAKYPAYNKTISTGQTTLKKAYQEAYRLMSTFSEEKQSFHKMLLDTYKDTSTCTYNAAKSCLKCYLILLPEIKSSCKMQELFYFKPVLKTIQKKFKFFFNFHYTLLTKT